MKSRILMVMTFAISATTAHAELSRDVLGCEVDYQLLSIKDGKALNSGSSGLLAVERNSPSTENPRGASFNITEEIELTVTYKNHADEPESPELMIDISGEEDDVRLVTQFDSKSDMYVEQSLDNIYVDGKLLSLDIECYE